MVRKIHVNNETSKYVSRGTFENGGNKLNSNSLSSAHASHLSAPEDNIVGKDYAGEDLHEGDEVFNTDDGMVRLDDIREYMDYCFGHTKTL